MIFWPRGCWTDALGDPTRRRIIEALRHGPTPVGVLADNLPVGRPNVSKHLKVLRGAGLIDHHTVGTRNFYSLAPDGLDVAQRWLVEQWDSVLTSFADHVDRKNNEKDPS